MLSTRKKGQEEVREFQTQPEQTRATSSNRVTKSRERMYPGTRKTSRCGFDQSDPYMYVQILGEDTVEPRHNNLI